jgi:hypothetical protein
MTVQRLIFYNETGEFEEKTLTIIGNSSLMLSLFHNIGGVDLFPVDQATDQTWYTYANVPDGDPGGAIPYWSATSNNTNAQLVRVSNGTENNYAKTDTVYRARCVRTPI